MATIAPIVVETERDPYSIMLVFVGMLAMPLTAYAQGDAAAGEKIFAHCAACHSNKPDENKIGPSLAGVFGRKSGTPQGFEFGSRVPRHSRGRRFDGLSAEIV